MKEVQTAGWLLAGLRLIANSVHAQGPSATISGRLREQTGAVLSGVSVPVTHPETGRARNVGTDSEERHRLPARESGAHAVQASLEGFRTVVKPGVVRTVGSKMVADPATGVGQSTENVTVFVLSSDTAVRTASLEDKE